MISKVTFDLGVDNKSVVKVHTQHSEDVRDKIARDFSAGFCYTSNLAYCQFLPVDSGQSLLEIYPITGSLEDSNKVVKNLTTTQLINLGEAIAKELPLRKDFGIADNPQTKQEIKSKKASTK